MEFYGLKHINNLEIIKIKWISNQIQASYGGIDYWCPYN